MIKLVNFAEEDYETLISWIDTEDLLMQFAGPGFRFPLTKEQLAESASDPSRFSFTIVDTISKERIGHCEVLITDTTAKIGRVIIGSEQAKGKGYCGEIMRKLVEFIYSRIDRTIIELNVFDFNRVAISCYEKVGFRINPDLKFERKVRDETWIALNMILDHEVFHKAAHADVK